MSVTLPASFIFNRNVELNVAHDLNLLLSGLSELSSNTVAASFFANGNGITFGSNSNTVTASVVPGGGSNFLFSDANGVSFGTAGSTVTASVNTNYAPPGAYLTTAMASNRGSDFVQATAAFHGTNATGTIASNAISVSVAPPSAGSVNFSAGSTSDNLTAITFADSNGISFGLNAGTLTATVATNYQSSGAYLTTAALSQDSSKYAGTNATMTGGSITVNTSGVSINLPAYLTTAQTPGAYLTTAALSQDSSKYAGTSTGMTGGSVTLDTSGIAINLPAYLTTAMASGASTQFVQANATVAGTNVSGTIASNVISLSVAAAGAGAVQSHWANGFQLPTGVTNALWLSNTSNVQPIFVPYPISIGWMRLFGLNSVGANTTMATSNAATTFTNRFETGIFAVIYSYGGAGVLAYVTSASGSIGNRIIVSASASNWTMSYEHSYYIEGVSSQSSTNTSVSTSNLSVSSNPYANWTGTVAIDIPCAISLPAGNYWLAIGFTTAQTTAYSTRFTVMRPSISAIYVSTLFNVNFNYVGQATNSSHGIKYGMGFISAAASGTTSSLSIANISSTTSNIIPYFEWVRTT